jgi:uncharacterized RDD family membrane protein YckC
VVTDAADAPRYATFARRMRALVLDAVVLLAALLGVVFLAATVHFGQTMRLGLFGGLIALAILYEPVLVAYRGNTIGQQLCNLRVVAPTPTGRLPLWKAFCRWLLKGVTGLASFATMGATQHNQALHDLAFGTTVQIADPGRARTHEFVLERPAAPSGRLPSRARRLVVILGYLALLFLVLCFLLPLAASAGCIEGGRCLSGERLWVRIVGTGWASASIAACIFGWKGRLPGARHQPLLEPPRDGPAVIPHQD